jgi:hypothetical protein
VLLTHYVAERLTTRTSLRASRIPRSVDEIGYLSIGNSYRCGITPSSGMPSTPLKPGGANNRETSQEKEAPVPVG